MELIAFLIVSAIALGINSLIYILEWIATPSGMVYLGTVHWAGDYFYYLSQFAQGSNNWFLSYDLFTGDFPYKTMVGWVNVFIGRLFYLAGLNHFLAYQISLLIFTAVFLYIAYRIICQILPEKKDLLLRNISFVFFIFANAFPKSGSYYDYWFNQGIPFNRLVQVPHQMLARVCLSLILLLSMQWWKSKVRRVYFIAGFLISSVLLSSVEPVHWLIAIGILILVPLLITKPVKIINFAPLFCVLISGLPVVFYLQQLFREPPFSQLKAWELSQSLKVNILDFFLANGAVSVLGLFGIFSFFRKDPGRLTAIIFTLITVFLYLSPVPYYLGIANVRFQPAITTLFFACMTVVALSDFGLRFKKRTAFLLLSSIVLLFINIIPLFRQFEAKLKMDAANAYYFVDRRAIETFEKAQEVSNEEDVFLVIWPYNTSFPGVTGRHGYWGHHLLTIDNASKENQASEFFYNKDSEFDREKFLILNNIKYVIAYPWMETVRDLEILEKIFDNGFLVLYRVKK